MRKRERDTHTQREGWRERETERQRERDRDRQTERDRERRGRKSEQTDYINEEETRNAPKGGA